MAVYAEILQQHGWEVTVHPDSTTAHAWLDGRVAALAPTVNPARRARARPKPRPVVVNSLGETICPACLTEVSAGIGIHFDCRKD